MTLTSILHVRGVTQESEQSLLTAADFSSSVAIVASKRLYKNLLNTVSETLLPPLIPLVPLQKSFREIEKYLVHGDVTVLASGDPLFYGIGRRLMGEFSQQEVCFYPALSSMQVCFARFAIPWDDARFVSLHGRTSGSIATELLNFPKVFVFTDPEHSPDVIAKRLLQECCKNVPGDTRVYVAENLGGAEERLFRGNLQGTAGERFTDPNVMILINSKRSSEIDFSFGLQENEIHHSRGLITKDEVRAAVIHTLRLPDTGVLWDVGAGSGSVGLESARFFPDLQVRAVEKEKEQWQNIESNRERFGAWNLELVKGRAPEVLAELPAPARIFVGGSGGNLEAILELCVEKLLPEGIIVVNAVISKTAKLAPRILHKLGLNVEIKEITVTRYSYPQEEKKQLNPISIIVGKKRNRSQGFEQE